MTKHRPRHAHGTRLHGRGAPSRRTRCTAPRPSAPSSTSRSPGQPFPRGFIRALALIKLAAAETNGELGLLERGRRAGDRRRGRRGRRRRPRRPVPDRHLPDGLGHLDQHEHERGRRPPRGEAARRGPDGPPQRRRQSLPELERRRSRPPSSCRRRWRSRRRCSRRSIELQTALAAKADEFWPVVKTGRTHLQDATPIRLGQEFSGLRGPGRGSRPARPGRPGDELLSVPLGGTAVGTGINAHPEFAARTCQRLSELTGLAVRETRNHFHAQAIARRGDRGARGDPDHRARPVEDRLRHPADGHGPAGRPGRAGPARDPAGLVASCRAR